MPRVMASRPPRRSKKRVICNPLSGVALHITSPPAAPESGPCLKNSNMTSGEEFCPLASNFFAGILADFTEKIGPSRGQKARRLGVLTIFKQGLAHRLPDAQQHQQRAGERGGRICPAAARLAYPPRARPRGRGGQGDQEIGQGHQPGGNAGNPGGHADARVVHRQGGGQGDAPQRVAARFSSPPPGGPRRRSQLLARTTPPMPASTSPPSRLGRGRGAPGRPRPPRSREAQVIRVVRAAIIRLGQGDPHALHRVAHRENYSIQITGRGKQDRGQKQRKAIP